LEPLARESVEQLVAGMTGDGKLKETLGAWIFRSVGGNPFFLEEMLKHLVEQGLLHRESGQWRFIEEDLKKLEVPANGHRLKTYAAHQWNQQFTVFHFAQIG
jgi:predicted ATPase